MGSLTRTTAVLKQSMRSRANMDCTFLPCTGVHHTDMHRTYMHCKDVHYKGAHFLWPAPSTPAAGFAGGAEGAGAACAACEEAECLGGAGTGLLVCLHTDSKGQCQAFVTGKVQLVL